MQTMRGFIALLSLLLSLCVSGFKSAERRLSPPGSATALGSSTVVVAAVAPVAPGTVNALASLCAGSIAGACGVGIGYPLDSLKVRAQSLSSAGKRLGLLGMIKVIYRNEGITGFYSGVGGSMLGQALIAAAAFSSNNFAKGILTEGRSVSSATLLEVALAASFGGLVTSFFTNPIERVKVIMQSSGTNASYLSSLIDVLKVDGIFGLLFRGMEATMWREIPGYALYFWGYELLKRSALARLLGPSTPLVCGGLAGMLSWIPVYPFDVLKTNMQTTQGGGSETQSMYQVGARMAEKHGWGVFYEGIEPKLLRAALVHATTFFVFERVMAMLRVWTG